MIQISRITLSVITLSFNDKKEVSRWWNYKKHPARTAPKLSKNITILDSILRLHTLPKIMCTQPLELLLPQTRIQD